MDSAWIADHAEKVGIVGVLAFDIVAMVKGWVVTQSAYDRIMQENKTLGDKLDEANNRDRQRLDRAEADLANLVGRGR